MRTFLHLIKWDFQVLRHDTKFYVTKSFCLYLERKKVMRAQSQLLHTVLHALEGLHAVERAS